MKISIVVPAFNEKKFPGETLAHTKAASGAFVQIGWESELIVCDNNSNDRTAEPLGRRAQSWYSSRSTKFPEREIPGRRRRDHLLGSKVFQL